MSTQSTILVIDDDTDILRLLERTFEEFGFECVSTATGDNAAELVERTQPDVAFVDLTLPGTSGLDVLRSLKELDANLPVVIITGKGGLDSTVEAMHLGAFDYIPKPLDIAKLLTATNRALEMRRLGEQNCGPQTAALPAERIVGRHPSMVDVFKLIGTVSQLGNNSTVLILGETGVGKELVAQAIHASGPTTGHPFVNVQCAGVPETLIDNELFGHERGAFTGAQCRQAGRVEAAGQGSLFFDEIGDISLPIQAKILRLLETGDYERLGGTQTLTARCRFLAATNRDLERAVKDGTFREDLYFRLRVIPIRVPPLRERREDIPLLIDAFLRQIGQRTKRRLLVSTGAQELLLAHEYPGNVRELRHLLEQAAALTRGPVILPEHLPEVRQPQDAQAHETSMPIVSPELNTARKHVMALFERQFLIDTLRATRGNVTAAAERAGVRRQYFQKLMKRHGLRSDSFRM